MIVTVIKNSMHDFQTSKDFCSHNLITSVQVCTFSAGKKRKPGFNLSGTRVSAQKRLGERRRIDGSNSEYTEKGRNLQLLSTDRGGAFCTLFIPRGLYRHGTSSRPGMGILAARAAPLLAFKDVLSLGLRLWIRGNCPAWAQEPRLVHEASFLIASRLGQSGR